MTLQFELPPPERHIAELLEASMHIQLSRLKHRLAALEFAQAVAEYALQGGDAYLAQMAETFREEMEKLK